MAKDRPPPLTQMHRGIVADIQEQLHDLDPLDTAQMDLPRHQAKLMEPDPSPEITVQERPRLLCLRTTQVGPSGNVRLSSARLVNGHWAKP